MEFFKRTARQIRTRGGHAMRWQFLLVLASAAVACASQAPRPAAAAGGELEFTGSWNAVGTRHIISLGGTRTGSIVVRSRM